MHLHVILQLSAWMNSSKSRKNQDKNHWLLALQEEAAQRLEREAAEEVNSKERDKAANVTTQVNALGHSAAFANSIV